MTLNYAGRSHDEAMAARHRQKQKAQEQAGGEMAVEGTEVDAEHSCGELSERGKQVWRTGSGIERWGERVRRHRRSDVMRTEQFIPSASIMNRKLVLNPAGEHGQRSEALCGPAAVASRSARQPSAHAQSSYAAVLRGANAAPATSCPAIASASGGFRLSTIELGIRIVAPRSLVVS